MSAEIRELERYRIADLLVDAAQRQVVRDGREIVLPALSFDLLLALTRRAPAVLSTDELMTDVWPGRVINAETVAKRVELVRQALGDDTHEPRYIALARGRGYRLVAPVQRLGGAEPAAAGPRWPAWRRFRPAFTLSAAVLVVCIGVLSYLWMQRDTEPRAAVGARPSVAVLPFVNLSDDPANTYFSDGISEELLNSLARLPGLRVVSRTSSFSFRDENTALPDIARTLEADHIIEGSVRRAGERVRVTAQLIDVATDSHLWSQSYDRRLDDIFAIQEDIAANIIEALKVTLDPQARAAARAADSAGHLEAYQLYLSGLYLWHRPTESNVRQAIGFLTRSVALDPNLARAHAALAGAHAASNFWFYDQNPRALELAERSAARALELDPALPEGYAVLGEIAGQRLQWEQAERAFLRALEINPNDASANGGLASSYAEAGRTREAIRHLHRALELDPISPPRLIWLGYLYINISDFDRGCPYLQRATEVGGSRNAWFNLARCHRHRGDERAAADAERTGERLAGIAVPVSAMVQEAARNAAKKPEALAALRAATRGGVDWASSYWLLGELDAAFDAIEAPLERHDTLELTLLWDVAATDLRAHPRFRELAQRVGLVKYWRSTSWPDQCRPAGDSFTCD